MPPGQGLLVGPIAQAVLVALEQHYAAAPAALPDRRFIAAGQGRLIGWDAPQVSVALEQVGVGQAPGQGGQPTRVGNPAGVGLRHAILTVQIVRPTPESEDGVTPPDAAEVTAAGLALMVDAGMLSQALTEMCAAAKAAAGPIQGSAIAGAVQTVGPLGGLAAVEATITVTAGVLG